ncbi:hypothetical protein [Nitriliruptor alkaliphilus]|uniref:hypothetical protein n=1 Tax=Nitriliruptor alkaliphilus TaxID=427918 RepID=UPI000696EAA5|nr:hypothetical protein [Nitriliruptor alkaliphilus]
MNRPAGIGSNPPPAPNLDDVPELADVAEDLDRLAIRAVRIVEHATADGAGCSWSPVVVLAISPGLVVPWSLGGRATSEDARGAVEELLRGLVAGRRDAARLHPSDGETVPLERLEQVVSTEQRRAWGSNAAEGYVRRITEPPR